MRTYLDCIPCFFRQLLATARIAGASSKIQKKILDEFARIIPGIPLTYSPPQIAYIGYKVLNKISGNGDPYSEIRKKSNRIAMGYYQKLKTRIKNSRDRLLEAVGLAILGNIIDFGVRDDLNLKGEIKTVLNKDNFRKPIFHYYEFKTKLKDASSILFLGDNAGEIVFDRILIEEIKRIYPAKKIYYAVKGGPIINDAILEDALQTGMDKVAEIITTGIAMPGTVINLCSRDFKKIYTKADMIISKGQGNFESLSRSSKDIFFMFMVKCSVVANHIGCNISDLVLLYNKKNGGEK